MSRFAAAVVAIAVGASGALAGCSGPEPPKLTPQRAAIRAVSTSGLDLAVQIDAYNPNAFALTTRSVQAKLTLDGRLPLGPVSLPHGVDLAPKKTTRLDVPLSLRWTDLAGVAALAASGRDVPFAVEGTMEIGGKSLRVSLPFKMNGTLTNADLVKATMSSLPKIPGLPIPGVQ